MVNNSKVRIRTASTFIRNLNILARPWNEKILNSLVYICMCLCLYLCLTE